MGAPLGPIQQLPAGLTGLLGLKNLGRVPDSLAGFVQPTTDMFQLWLNYGARSNQGVVHGRTLITGENGIRFFSPSAILVPNDEWWFVHQYTVNAVMGLVVGETIQGLAPAMAYNQAGTIDWCTLGEPPWYGQIASNAAQAVQVVATAQNFWAPPGAQLGLHLGALVSATGVGFTGRYQVTRLRI